MAQYTKYSVNVTNGSTTVTGTTGTEFLNNVSAGNSFKLKDSPVVYTVSSVVSNTELTLSTAYQGATATSQLYQIARDFTPNFGLAEVNVGDQDWPTHLTQDTIRKIDQILGEFSSGFTFKGSWNATTGLPAIPAAAPANLGWMYKVDVAGATNVNGITLWEVGDSILSNGSAWVKIPGPLHTVLDLVDAKVYTVADNLIKMQTMMVQHIAFA